jgi:hypothetical protein
LKGNRIGELFFVLLALKLEYTSTALPPAELNS